MNTSSLINVYQPGRIIQSTIYTTFWHGKKEPVLLTQEFFRLLLQDYSNPVVLLKQNNQLFISNQYDISTVPSEWEVLAACPPFLPEFFGDPTFQETYGVKYPLYGGAMANGISSTEFVIALGKAGFMGSFGAGGLLPNNIEAGIKKLKESLVDQPYLINLINSPFEPSLEERTVDLFLKNNIQNIEASAYLTISKNLVRYRASGLSAIPDGSIKITHRIIAKVSRKEVAIKFLEPASNEIINSLLEEGLITSEQARLASLVPMADDITVEADSGGHTDNRPLVGILPAIIRLRNQVQEKRNYTQPVRIGAAGGIATPES
ncbi:MAG: PfaD family protein, partial [uncultured bacterium]